MQSTIGLNRVGTYSLPYASPSAETEDIKQKTGAMTGIEAIQHVLREKRYRQEGRKDSKIYSFVGETGSGKSTLLVASLFIDMLHRKGGLICTQPRINLAINNAETLAKFYPELIMGENIGYQTSVAQKLISSGSGIMYVTIQVLLNQIRMLSPEKFGKRYKFVIVDEVHEVSEETQMMLFQIKEYVKKYYKETWCPTFIMMSATIYPPDFLEYFDVEVKSPYNSARVLGTSNYPITEKYLPDNTTGPIIEPLVMRVKECIQPSIDAGTTQGDILITLRGAMDISEALSSVAAMLKKEGHDCIDAEDMSDEQLSNAKVPTKLTFVLIRWMSLDVQLANKNIIALRKPQMEKEVKIIVSSTVSESGVTIPTLKYVIDGGWQTAPVYIPLKEAREFMQLPITRMSMIQRKGRVGRVSEGTFAPLYSKTTAEMLRTKDYPSTVLKPGLEMQYLVYFNYLIGGQPDVKDPYNAAKMIMKTRKESSSFDAVNSIILLQPIAFDNALISFRKLYTNDLITLDGQLTEHGVILNMIGADSIPGAIFKAMCLRYMIHPFDVAVMSSIMSDSWRDFHLNDTRIEIDVDSQFYEPDFEPPENSIMYIFQTIQFIVRDYAAGIAPSFAHLKKDKILNIIAKCLIRSNVYISGYKCYLECSKGEALELEKKLIKAVMMSSTFTSDISHHAFLS